MTERHAGYLVILHKDIREDAEDLITAIKQLRGVIAVEPVPADATQMIADSRAKVALQDKLLRVFKEA